jgi:hypothetical protein
MPDRILAIETGIEPEYENALQEAARAAGWAVHRVQHIPFTDTFVTGDPNMGHPLPDGLIDNPNVWFHGSIQAAKVAQKATKWQVHAPWAQLRCSAYYPILGERILQRDHLFTTVAEIATDKDKLYASSLVEDETLFFRPDGNDKLFTGGCISLPDFDKGYSLMTFYEPPPTSVVVVARPQRIRSEARFLVVGGKLITGSYYKTGGQTVRLEAAHSLMRIAEDHLAFCLERGFNPAPSWVLDLAETKNGWHIIEVGATSCCGLYKCDMGKFIAALGTVL